MRNIQDFQTRTKNYVQCSCIVCNVSQHGHSLWSELSCMDFRETTRRDQVATLTQTTKSQLFGQVKTKSTLAGSLRFSEKNILQLFWWGFNITNGEFPFETFWLLGAQAYSQKWLNREYAPKAWMLWETAKFDIESVTCMLAQPTNTSIWLLDTWQGVNTVHVYLYLSIHTRPVLCFCLCREPQLYLCPHIMGSLNFWQFKVTMLSPTVLIM